MMTNTQTTTNQTAGDHATQIAQAQRVTINNTLRPAEPDDAPALDTYLRWLFRITLELNLGGIDPKVAGAQRDACLELPEVYTALLTMSTADHEARVADKRDVLDRQRLRPAVDLLNAEPRLVLLGEPGSGKSMFVDFAALCMAGELLGETCANVERLTQPLPNDKGEPEDQSQPWQHQGLLPVKFVLRDVAAKSLPEQPGAPGAVRHLLDYLEQFLTERELAPAFAAITRHWDAHGGLVLFDGLDEVSEADQRRGQILKAVEDFACRFGKCRILVTCRTYAYQQQAWRLKDFPVAVLSPFTDGQIIWFVQRWYAHVAARRDTSRENWQGRAALLQQAVFRSPQLRGFARRPLLLTLMASLHAWRGGSLPEKRAELYEDATDMLLETWVEQKTVITADGSRQNLPSLEDVLNVSKYDLKPVLQHLAFEAHQRQPAGDIGTADIPERDLITALIDLGRAKRKDPLKLADHLSNRVGLLVSRGHKVYAFPHRSFQEYLAACHLTVGDYPYNIAELVRDSPDRWREIALLAAAKTSEYFVMLDGFVSALCRAPAPEIPHTADSADAYAAILGAQAVVEAQKTRELTARKPMQVMWLRGWLRAILTAHQPDSPLPALERARAGDLLAAFGDDRKGVGCVSTPLGNRRSLSEAEGSVPDIDWIDVPAETFLMGNTPDEAKGSWNPKAEQPQHKVRVSAFQISRYPVTNAQYRAFIDAGGYTEKWQHCWTPEGWDWRVKKKITEPNWAGGAFDLPNHPVVRVSWYEAAAFCNWLTEALTPNPSPNGRGEFLPPLSSQERGPGGEFPIRLPSEAEWEYAARGRENRTYPWTGSDITPEHANYGATNLNATSAVGAFPAGRAWCGADDLAGNVWEWCADVWHDNHNGAPDDGSARLEGKDIDLRLLKGGAWYGSPDDLRCADRGRVRRDIRDGGRGFRVVRRVGAQVLF